jgi:predicted AlkP superfamily phosphohydrolase/phosphomutase
MTTTATIAWTNLSDTYALKAWADMFGFVCSLHRQIKHQYIMAIMPVHILWPELLNEFQNKPYWGMSDEYDF